MYWLKSYLSLEAECCGRVLGYWFLLLLWEIQHRNKPSQPGFNAQISVKSPVVTVDKWQIMSFVSL